MRILKLHNQVKEMLIDRLGIGAFSSNNFHIRLYMFRGNPIAERINSPYIKDSSVLNLVYYNRGSCGPIDDIDSRLGFIEERSLRNHLNQSNLIFIRDVGIWVEQQ